MEIPSREITESVSGFVRSSPTSWIFLERSVLRSPNVGMDFATVAMLGSGRESSTRKPHRYRCRSRSSSPRVPEPGQLAREFAEIARSSPSLVAVLDCDLCYLSASPSWVQRYLSGTPDWLGRHHHKLLPDLPERFRDVHRRALEGEVFHEELDHFRRADGATHWISWSVGPWWTEDGLIGGIVMSIHDVTELREAKRRLREQSRIADRMASIGMLGAGLGHDMQNLLLPLRAHVNAISTRAQQDGAAHHAPHVDALRRGLNHLQQLCDSLHLLASDEHSPVDVVGGEMLLAGWWEQHEPLFRCAMPRRTRLEAHISNDLPPLAMSGHVLTRAILNLLTNAARAIAARLDQLRDGGSVVIEVRQKTDACGNWVQISVSDNGIGMTPEVRRRATEAFFTTRNGGRGSGLGLAFVSRVVADVGGRLEIDSEQGIGTTMSLVLPACE
jgi:PAS domain S-box-containing protein